MIALKGLLIVVFGWLLVRAWRQYFLDAHREHLFALRDELFEMAKSGRVGFDDPEYGAVRDSINERIHYAHVTTTMRMGPLLALMALLLKGPSELRKVDAPMPTNDTLRQIRERAAIAHLGFMATNATLVMFFIFAWVVREAYQDAYQKHRKPRELVHREVEARLIRVEPRLNRVVAASTRPAHWEAAAMA